jgi:8-oxo-dGTP diphosphatase
MPAAVRNRPTIDVAVAILRDAAGRVLVAERLPRQLSAGYWELPGGKVDPGETAARAAAREAAEEVGVEVVRLEPFVAYEHRFPLRRLRLSFFLATRWHGTPHGREGQRVAWITPHAPEVAPLLPSNRRALALLGLPDRGWYGGPQQLNGLADGRHAQRARDLWIVAGEGAHFAQRQHWLLRATQARRQIGGPTLVEGDLHQAVRADADGLCSRDSRPQRWLQRPDVGLWAVVCRNAAEAEQFAALGADIGIVERGAVDDVALQRALRHFPAAYLSREAQPSADGRPPLRLLERW